MSLILRNCVLSGQAVLQDSESDGLVDIAIEGDVIREIGKGLELRGEAREIDVSGNMVSPPFVDPHLHLDAVLTRGNPSYNMSGTLLEGIHIWGKYKEGLTVESLKANACEAIRWEVANGVLSIRTHADTTHPSFLPLKALVELREEMQDLVDIQIVAFPQDGIYTHPDGENRMSEAIALGADVVGGIPHNELTREDGVKDVEFVYALAEKHNLLVDIHVDETGDEQSRFLEVMARENIVRGMQGRAAASHATAMHNYNNDYAFKLLGILKRADMHIITNPFDNAVLQNRLDGYPRYRGHTRVDELYNRGINVCIGHDSIMDPWYPMGRGSMLQGANLLMHMAHLTTPAQIDSLFDMITVNSAQTMHLHDYGIKVGNTANLIVLDASSRFDAIRLESECLYVIRKGKIVLETAPAKRNLTLDSLSSNLKALDGKVDFKLGR